MPVGLRGNAQGAEQAEADCEAHHKQQWNVRKCHDKHTAVYDGRVGCLG